MNDLISRQEAIDAVNRLSLGETDAVRLSMRIADYLNRMPPAQPERKSGRWEMKPDPYGFFEEIPVCSACGCTTKWREKYPYCPNCGAMMKGADDE